MLTFYCSQPLSLPPEKPYLPDSILWRQKEQFSDGVGYSWIGGLKEHAEKDISDELFAKAAEVFPCKYKLGFYFKVKYFLSLQQQTSLLRVLFA